MTALDFLLLLMILIWGTNFSIVKVALRDFPEVAFNAMRLRRRARPSFSPSSSRRRRARRCRRSRGATGSSSSFLGSIGTFLYQFCFVVGGQAHERRQRLADHRHLADRDRADVGGGRSRAHPPGALARHRASRMFGLYLVVGHGVDLSGADAGAAMR